MFVSQPTFTIFKIVLLSIEKNQATFKRVHVYEDVNILAKTFSCIFT